jgi:hypothetical protein
MEEITKEIIERVLSRYKKAKRIAVENFLSTSEGLRWEDQEANLEMDAALYRWKSDTIKAIRTGLFMMKQAGLLR